MPASTRVPKYAIQGVQHDEPNDRVSTAFGKLVAAAADLNSVSDEIAEPISTIDQILQKLNLGIPTWTRLEPDDDEPASESTEVGYAKIRQRWGLAIRRRTTAEGESEVCEEWAFNDAPRAYRLKALEKLPELVETLAESTTRTIAKLKTGITATKHAAETMRRIAHPKAAG